MIKILHIILDDKFFDEVYDTFEKDYRILNEALLIVPNKDYVIQRIKSKERVRIIWNKDLIKQLIIGNNYNIIFFHSLPPSQWWLFDYIPKDRIVIWWAFGFDIYYGSRGLKPLLELNLYKDKTKMLIKKNYAINSWLHSVHNLCLRLLFNNRKKQMKVIRRINYFIPVLPLEFQLMKEAHSELFHAQEFYFKNVPIKGNYTQKDPHGGIIIGNSATYSNNHLDIWDMIGNIGIVNRRLVIPLSYGIRRYTSKINKIMTSQYNEVVILDKMIPIDEYQKILNSCSYAIYGVIRQQAIWNIYFCLLNGIKVFLYKESIVYRSLKDLGYAVYTIENINQNSFLYPLTKKETNINQEIYRKQLDREYNIYENTISEIIGKI